MPFSRNYLEWIRVNDRNLLRLFWILGTGQMSMTLVFKSLKKSLTEMILKMELIHNWQFPLYTLAESKPSKFTKQNYVFRLRTMNNLLSVFLISSFGTWTTWNNVILSTSFKYRKQTVIVYCLDRCIRQSHQHKTFIYYHLIGLRITNSQTALHLKQ